LAILKHVLWSSPDQQDEISKLCARLSNPINGKATELTDQAASVYDATMAAHGQSGDTQQMVVVVAEGSDKLKAIHAGMLDEVAGLRADLRRLIAEGTNVREDTVITRLAAFQGVRAKAQIYADLLGLRLDRMRAEIGELETQARRLLLRDAKPAGTNGKGSAGHQIIQEAPGIVEAGDELMGPPLSHAAD
jgi:hypothetical protein